VSAPEQSDAVRAVPKADLHLHQERLARTHQAVAARDGGEFDDWPAWRRELEQLPRGIARLDRLWRDAAMGDQREDPELRRARFRAVIEEAASEGALLVEVRVGNELLLVPDVLADFRAAVSSATVRFPRVHAELVGTIKAWEPPPVIEAVVSSCLSLAEHGLSGVDFLYRPYAHEANWESMYAAAARLSAGGLGVTAHAGEFSEANVEAALSLPGISRIGHAVHAAWNPRLLDRLRRSGVAVECCLTSNVLLGAVDSYVEHPIRMFVEEGVPVVLGTDAPLMMGISIGAEYQRAADLGFGIDQLRSFTRSAIEHSFAPEPRKAEMLERLNDDPGASALDANG